VAISTRVREESGFGLVELLIAMAVMVIGITALVAAMSSGMVALNRASRASTGAALADIQMEGYRKVKYTDAVLAPTCTTTGTPWSTNCFVSSTKPGPDGRSYRIDAAIRFDCAVGGLDPTVTVPSPAKCTGTGASRPAKLVTIVVYDPSTSPPKQLFRETSTFDQATG
jgi:prepilin-type N-terminal cleavage/methylation domain-containing protein